MRSVDQKHPQSTSPFKVSQVFASMLIAKKKRSHSLKDKH